jgi:hypothetical protein
MKQIHKGFKLYGAKNKDIGDKILDFTKKNEDKKKEQCLYDNISWFGDLQQAKHYDTADTLIFKWEAKKELHLVNTNKTNQVFFNNLFLNSNITLSPSIKINKNKIDSKYNHPFLKMTNNQKAYYEFAFAFGYISVEEQYLFMKLLYNLIQDKIININMRNGQSIASKLYSKIKYYSLYPFSKQEMNNRLSFYELDKFALVNLCLLLKNTNKYHQIDGVYQKNVSSFWFPDFLIYKMNIQEYILFSPHKSLKYDRIV